MNKGPKIGIDGLTIVLGLKTVEMRGTISLLARRHWDGGGPVVGV